MSISCFSPGLFYLLEVVNACQFKNQPLGQMLQTHCPTCGQHLDKYIKQRIILSTGENTLHSVLQQINYLSHNLDYADSFIMYFQCPTILISGVGLSQFSIQTKFCIQMNAEQTQWRADVFYRILALSAPTTFELWIYFKSLKAYLADTWEGGSGRGSDSPLTHVLSHCWIADFIRITSDLHGCQWQSTVYIKLN